MDIFFIAFEIQTYNTDEISMNINQEIFESEFSFDQIDTVKSFSISVEFSLILAQISPVTIEIIFTPIKAKTPKTIELTNAFILINIAKNSKFLLPKFVKENALANSIKKRKSKAIEKILLFSSELSQQKIKQAMQQTKIALITTYFFVENADILITIDFINQIIDEKSKFFEKTQFSNINDKLDQILKKMNFSKNFQEQFFKGKKPQTKIILLFITAIVKSFLQKFKSRQFIFSSFMVKTIKKVNLTLFFKSTGTETLKISQIVFDVSGIEIRQKTSKSSKKIKKMIERKKKRLIIILNRNIFNYDPYEYKKKINFAFKKIKINVQIVIVTKSVFEKNIVMTTVDSNNVDQLLKHQSIGNDIFKPKHVIKDEIGYQFIINYINVEQFNDMKTLQSKIETYNFIKLKFAPRGLSKKIDNKMHSSIVVTVSSHNDVEIIKSRFNIESICCKTNKFNSTQSITQCIKCQKFEHVQTICKNDAKCEICVHKHETNDYICIICKSKNSCPHIIFKCANCNETHVAKSTKCEIFLGLRSNNAINVEEEL